MVWQCPVSGRPWRTYQACTRLDCEVCYGRNAKRRGARAMERMGEAPAGLGAFTFTVPRELWALSPREIVDLRRKLAAIIGQWAAARWRVEVGVTIAVHPAGDTCRCGHKARRAAESWNTVGNCVRCGAEPTWKPHYDALVPLVGLRNGRAIRLPPKLARTDLADLKRRWSELVIAASVAAGVELAPSTWSALTRDPISRPGVDYRFRRRRAKRAHAARYSLRPFPAWSAAARTDRELSAALSPQSYLLASSAAGRRDDVGPWLAQVRGEPPAADGLRCTCCAVPQQLVLIDVCRRGTRRWAGWSWVPLHEGVDPPPPRPSPPPEPVVGDVLPKGVWLDRSAVQLADRALRGQTASRAARDRSPA